MTTIRDRMKAIKSIQNKNYQTGQKKQKPSELIA